MKRYLATLLLAVPFVVAIVPTFADSSRTIDAAMSHIKAWLVVTMAR
jgi:hypothetical protein